MIDIDCIKTFVWSHSAYFIVHKYVYHLFLQNSVYRIDIIDVARRSFVDIRTPYHHFILNTANIKHILSVILKKLIIYNSFYDLIDL